MNSGILQISRRDEKITQSLHQAQAALASKQLSQVF
jgi:hypothetical protein